MIDVNKVEFLVPSPIEGAKIVTMVQNTRAINASFYCKPSPQDGTMLVLNADHYIMGYYRMKTGSVSWHRVVQATQRESIEKWLLQNYPVKAAA